MEVITDDCRILCRTLLAHGHLLSMQVVTLVAGKAEIEPFHVETAATLFEPAPVAVVSSGMAASSEITGHMAAMLKQPEPIGNINRYLAANNAYSTDNTALLILRGC